MVEHSISIFISIFFQSHTVFFYLTIKENNDKAILLQKLRELQTDLSL